MLTVLGTSVSVDEVLIDKNKAAFSSEIWTVCLVPVAVEACLIAPWWFCLWSCSFRIYLVCRTAQPCFQNKLLFTTKRLQIKLNTGKTTLKSCRMWIQGFKKMKPLQVCSLFFSFETEEPSDTFLLRDRGYLPKIENLFIKTYLEIITSSIFQMTASCFAL